VVHRQSGADELLAVQVDRPPVQPLPDELDHRVGRRRLSGKVCTYRQSSALKGHLH
jgi:hypothetical protein